jgi:hypothetical protein
MDRTSIMSESFLKVTSRCNSAAHRCRFIHLQGSLVITHTISSTSRRLASGLIDIWAQQNGILTSPSKMSRLRLFLDPSGHYRANNSDVSVKWLPIAKWRAFTACRSGNVFNYDDFF